MHPFRNRFCLRHKILLRCFSLLAWNWRVSIVNIFIAHTPLTRIAKNVNEIYERLSNAKAAIKDYQIILNAQKEYAAISSQINSMLNYIQTTITNEVMSVIHDGVLSRIKNGFRKFNIPQNYGL